MAVILRQQRGGGHKERRGAEVELGTCRRCVDLGTNRALKSSAKKIL